MAKKVDYVGNTPMKFLGYWIFVDLRLKHIKKLIEDKLASHFQKVDERGLGLNDVMKCLVYNSMLTCKVSWELMIYNLPVHRCRKIIFSASRIFK